MSLSPADEPRPQVAAFPHRYQTILHQTQQAFCLVQVLVAQPDAASDYRLLEVNATFEQLTGFVDPVGRTLRELAPAHEVPWADMAAWAARTGEPQHAERLAAAFGGRWFEVHALPSGPVGSEQVAMLFTDITGRKQVEARLQADAELNAFRVALGDALRPLAGPLAIQAAATQLLGQYLGVNRALYFQVLPDEETLRTGPAYVSGVMEMPAQVRLDDFHPNMAAQYRAGQTIVTPDAQADARYTEAAVAFATVAVHAAIGVPLRKDGQLVAILSVHQAVPRSWSATEVALVEEVAERTWAAVERARAEQALRASKERQSFLLQLSDALSTLSEPVAIQQVVTHLARLHFEADRCYYCEIISDQAFIRRDAAADGLPSVAGTYPLADFALLRAAIDAGRPFSVRDVRQDEAVDETLRQLCVQLQVISYLNVPVVKNGQAAGVLCLVQSTPRKWATADVALAADVAERTWSAVARARAEAALAASEAKYRTLFNSLDEGVTTLEVLFDEHARAVDARYLETNSAITRLTGISADFIGKRVSEFMPNLEPSLLETYGRILQTGEPERFEYSSNDLAAWFDVYAARVDGAGSHQVIVVYNNITERKHREANLAFLAEVSNSLMRLTDIDETMNALGEKLATYLGLSACAFIELQESAQIGVIRHGWHRADMPSLLGTYRMAEFVAPEVLRRCQAGEAVVIRDVWADPLTDGAQYAALNIGSFVSMPLVREGEWRFLLVVYRSDSYDWRQGEVDLLREFTLRVWTRLEQARAEQLLRVSEVKYRNLFDSIDEGFCLLEVFFDDAQPDQVRDYRLLEVNPAFEQQTGLRDVVGKFDSEVTSGSESYWLDLYGRVARTGLPARLEDYHASTGHWYSAYVARVGGAGSRQVTVVFADITFRKQAEEAEKLRLRLLHQQQQVAAVLEGQEEERRRIAESLHNGIGQVLFATRLQLDLLAPRPEPALARAKNLLGEAINQTRAVSHELAPTILTELGLQKAVETICRQLSQPDLLWHCYVDVDEPPTLPLGLQQAVYRLVQGLAHNVAQHAQASQVTLEVTALPAWLVVRVEDNGRGFDPATVQEGLGLKTLRSRVALLSGTLRLESAPGQGTLIEARLPITPVA